MPASRDGERMAQVHRLPRRRRQRRRLLAQWPITIVLAGVAAGLAVVAADHFRRGAVLLSASVLLACFLRVLLPEREAGMLAVRSRMVDVATSGTLGLLLTLFTFWVPPPTA